MLYSQKTWRAWRGGCKQWNQNKSCAVRINKLGRRVKFPRNPRNKKGFTSFRSINIKHEGKNIRKQYIIGTKFTSGVAHFKLIIVVMNNTNLNVLQLVDGGGDHRITSSHGRIALQIVAVVGGTRLVSKPLRVCSPSAPQGGATCLSERTHQKSLKFCHQTVWF